MNDNNQLWDVDTHLFTSMRGNYKSPSEKAFFKNMEYKELHELALSNDLLISEDSNPDHIYLVRVEYDEYIIGTATAQENEVHVMNLYEALSLNLKKVGLHKDITLLQWLRERDYKGVMYDHNFDLI